MSEEEEATGLELYSTQDLLNEVFGRFDHAVFAGLQPMTESRFDIFVDFTGCPATIAGLAQKAGADALSGLKPAE